MVVFLAFYEQNALIELVQDRIRIDDVLRINSGLAEPQEGLEVVVLVVVTAPTLFVLRNQRGCWISSQFLSRSDPGNLRFAPMLFRVNEVMDAQCPAGSRLFRRHFD